MNMVDSLASAQEETSPNPNHRRMFSMVSLCQTLP